jgi:DHA1 family tetracycline resistance protein-like MFS transporter
VGSPILGALSDRLGRRPVLLASLAVTTFAYALIVLALATKSLWLLGVALTTCGLGEANAAIASSVIADATDTRERPKYLGYMWSVASVSYVHGPVLGGALASSFGYTVPFVAVLLLLALTLLAVGLRFSETHPAPASGAAVPLARTLGHLRTVLTDRPIRALYLVNFIVFIASMGYWRVITEYLVEVFRLPVGAVTVDYAVFAVAAGLGNLFVMPALINRINMRPLSIIAVSTGGAAIALSLIPGPVWIPVAFGAVASLALALSFPALGGLLSSKVGPERQGAVLGNNTALTFLGEAIGVMGGSALVGLDPMLPMALFAALAAVAVAILTLNRGIR